MSEDLKDLVKFGGGFLLGLVVLYWGMGALIMGLSLPGDMADIAALRVAAAQVQPNEAEDVAGQVAEMNRTIASNKAYNRIWWSALIVPNAWDTVTPITMPSIKPEATQ